MAGFAPTETVHGFEERFELFISAICQQVCVKHFCQAVDVIFFIFEMKVAYSFLCEVSEQSSIL